MMELTGGCTCPILNISPENAVVKITERIDHCYNTQNSSLSERIARFTLTCMNCLGYFTFISISIIRLGRVHPFGHIYELEFIFRAL